MSVQEFKTMLKEDTSNLIVVLFTRDEDKDDDFNKYFEELKKKNNYKFTVFYVLYVQDAAEIFKQYGITGVPTMIGFFKRNKVGRIEGGDKDKLAELIKNNEPQLYKGKARVITDDGKDDSEYLDKLRRLAEQQAAQRPPAPKPSPKKQAQPKYTPPASPVKKSNPKWDETIRNNMRGDLLALESLDTEEEIDKLLDYLEAIGKANISFDDVQVYCMDIRDGKFTIPDKIPEPQNTEQEQEFSIKKELTRKQKEFVEFYKAIDVDESTAYNIAKDLEDNTSEDRLIEKLGEFNDYCDIIQNKSIELYDGFILLCEYFDISTSFNEINEGNHKNIDSVKEYIKEYINNQKNKFFASQKVKQLLNSPRSSSISPFDYGNDKEEERIRWEREFAIREAKKKREQRDKEIRHKLEIAEKIKQQRESNKRIEEQEKRQKQENALTAQQLLNKAQQTTSSGSKCKVALFGDGQTFTYLMVTGDTVESLFAKLFNDFPEAKDKNIVLLQDKTCKVVEYKLTNTLSEIGVKGFTKFKIQVKEKDSPLTQSPNE